MPVEQLVGGLPQWALTRLAAALEGGEITAGAAQAVAVAGRRIGWTSADWAAVATAYDLNDFDPDALWRRADDKVSEDETERDRRMAYARQAGVPTRLIKTYSVLLDQAVLLGRFQDLSFSVRQLSDLAGWAASTIHGHLADLEAIGLVDVARHGTQGHSTSYNLVAVQSPTAEAPHTRRAANAPSLSHMVFATGGLPVSAHAVLEALSTGDWLTRSEVHLASGQAQSTV